MLLILFINDQELLFYIWRKDLRNMTKQMLALSRSCEVVRNQVDANPLIIIYNFYMFLFFHFLPFTFLSCFESRPIEAAAALEL